MSQDPTPETEPAIQRMAPPQPAGETRAAARESVRRAWQERGFSCELWVDPPDTVWSDFVHETDELLLMIDGVMLLEIAGRQLRLEAGDEILIPAGARHTVRNIGGTTAHWLYGYRL